METRTVQVHEVPVRVALVPMLAMFGAKAIDALSTLLTLSLGAHTLAEGEPITATLIAELGVGPGVAASAVLGGTAVVLVAEGSKRLFDALALVFKTPWWAHVWGEYARIAVYAAAAAYFAILAVTNLVLLTGGLR